MVTFDDPRITLPAPKAGKGVGSTAPLLMRVSASVAALRKAPEADAVMVSQALHGEHVLLHREDGEFGYVQNQADRYCGWALMEALSAPAIAPTHRVKALRTYMYSQPNVRAAPYGLISLGAPLHTTEQREGGYVYCEGSGWIWEAHLAPLDVFEGDPAEVALRFLNAPYLWGGRESLGLDCSALVQAALGACGVTAPRDSDMQQAWLGTAIDDWQSPGTLKRNDLIFWDGHVGIMLDEKMFLHANGYHMAVTAEPLTEAISRIAKTYGEPVEARRIDLDHVKGVRPDWLTR